MKKAKFGVVGLLLTALIALTPAIAQTSSGQGNSPQPSANTSPVRPQRQAKEDQQKQQQQHRKQWSQQQSQSQQPQLQQQNLVVLQQPQLQQQGGPVVQQQQQAPTAEQQQQERRRQSQIRRSQRSHPVPASVISYATALQKCQHQWHPHVWWTEHYAVIVFSVGGYYYYDAGYWFPALGYSPNYEAYDYDGPIYTYGNLLPDQVILNVQRALTDLGYYAGAFTGSLSAPTREAIAAYQQDNDLAVNGIVDAPLVYSLGLQ
jgi:hypothetical protein